MCIFQLLNHSPYYPGGPNKVHCKWIDCAFGMGLVGGGKCAGYGIWWHHSCPEYIEEQDFLDSWEK